MAEKRQMETTAGLAEDVARRSADIKSAAAGKRLVEAVFNSIKDLLHEGHDVRITGFGTFSVSERTQPDVVFGAPNRRAGERVRDVKFRDSTALKGLLNG